MIAGERQANDQRLGAFRRQVISRAGREGLAVLGPLVVVGENGGGGAQHPTLTPEHHEPLEPGEIAHRRGHALEHVLDPHQLRGVERDNSLRLFPRFA